MWINDLILGVMCLFMVLGALDYYVLNHKLYLGWRFYEAFMMMGPLALSMVGIISLAPVLATWLSPIVVPVFEWFGADPSMFASMLLAIDMGAYPLATSLASTQEAAIFSWSLLGTMMGPTLVFTIPIALTVIQKKDRPYFAKGILIGMMTIPVGVFIGGFVAGYKPFWMIQNLVPSILLALLIAMGLWLFTNATIRFFALFGKGVELTVITGLVAIIIETLTGFTVIPGMAPLSEGVVIVGRITVTLAGAYPLVAFLNRKGEKLFTKWGEHLKLDASAMTGLMASLAHHLPMFGMMKDMTSRGKVVNAAFSVSGAFVIGSHLAFVAGVEKDMMVPVMIGKASAGVLAVVVALRLTKNDERENS
ncbi:MULTISPECIES: ethanolamine utilization protein EutH [Pontibacillus]|uniref:Ethanolamine utilization protein EutH n=1 Tax=Pontibacillus chungwhensis TaxID=265426 RepID=A0ABY8UV47_9BACI|nr:MULTISPECIES: ethanolamine utilization protein EutH [Pontibacillus]MCD5323246.1 ethanolamine utilization protein EutH [Pontibacillus sp. HN14]WIF96631.1 ethanolamine utilization protein EutH [Pontibacillus chungwhensis]